MKLRQFYMCSLPICDFISKVKISIRKYITIKKKLNSKSSFLFKLLRHTYFIFVSLSADVLKDFILLRFISSVSVTIKKQILFWK